MDQDQVLAILKSAFSALDDQELSNLEFHLRRETPVLCGVNANLYVNEFGHG